MLGDTAVVNFYGLGHMDLGSVMGAKFADLRRTIGTKRFRFAFLDGCDSGRLNFLFVTFGADGLELAQSDFMDPNFYDPNNTANVRKVRPGAFLGWRVLPPFAYPLIDTELDPTTQKSCTYRVYETMCNWHGQLVFFWQQGGYTLSDSIGQANQLATTWIGSTPLGTHDWILEATVPIAGGTTGAVFKPDYHLRKVGFGGLRFNGNNSYNHWSDWVHR